VVASSVAAKSMACFISANSLASALILLKTFREASTPKTVKCHFWNDSFSRMRSLIFQLIDTTGFILLVFLVLVMVVILCVKFAGGELYTFDFFVKEVLRLFNRVHRVTV
jgi:hypothetical protein